MSVRQIDGRSQIPLMDMAAQYRSIRSEVDEAVRSVLESGHFILGPNVSRFEEEVASYLGVGHSVGVASGTDALVLALRALGIGPGDEVIVPAFTFFATVEAVMLAGATPVLVDIEPETYGLEIGRIADRITDRTKAVIPVHLYGHPANIEALIEQTRDHGITVIEDNAQAFGAESRLRKTGSLGHIGCLSFFPSKNLGACGDGGMVVTNDAEIADRVRMLRTHGWRKKYHPEILGYNSRLDELQAAILRVKLPHIDAWNDRRRSLAHRYDQLLRDIVSIPREAAGAKHVYHLYVIRVGDRRRVQKHLQEQGIATAVYYPIPLHLTEPLQFLGHGIGEFPVAERASREVLAVPLYPEMTDQQIHEVAGALRQVLDENGMVSRGE